MRYQTPLRGSTSAIAGFCGISVSDHWHKEIELIYCVAGQITVTIEGKNYEACEGQAVFVNSCEAHSLSFQPGANSFFINGGDELLRDRFSVFVKNSCREHLIDFREGKSNIDEFGRSQMLNILKFLMEERRKESNTEIRIIRTGYIMVICGLLFRYLPWVSSNDVKKAKRLNRLDQIKPAIDLIETHFADDVTIDQAASASGYEKTSFCRVFHNITGVTFVSYLNDYRVNVAKKMMVDGAYSIGEIGERVGIPCSKSFSRIFKQYTGVSPREYMNSYNSI